MQEISLMQRRNYRETRETRRRRTRNQNSQTCNKVKDNRKFVYNFSFNQLEYKDDWGKKVLKITLLQTSLPVGWLLVHRRPCKRKL